MTGAGRRGRGGLAAFGALVVLLAAGFTALGVWQLERRVWKLDLIARVDARVHAPPSAPPGPAAWPSVSVARDEYRRVSVSGLFEGPQTRVQAVTERGPGFWVMAPLRTAAGFTVLVNRGFVPQGMASPPPPRGRVTVTGLLRLSEPHGGFLRANRPAEGRWYSRDVAAIARADGLHDVAPYFIDADSTPNPGGWPLGGLTVIHFRNAHLSYALTWFALALLSAGGGILLLRDVRRRRG